MKPSTFPTFVWHTENFPSPDCLVYSSPANIFLVWYWHRVRHHVGWERCENDEEIPRSRWNRYWLGCDTVGGCLQILNYPENRLTVGSINFNTYDIKPHFQFHWEYMGVWPYNYNNGHNNYYITFPENFSSISKNGWEYNIMFYLITKSVVYLKSPLMLSLSSHLHIWLYTPVPRIKKARG